ncbi:MAG: dienelactone hydrolase family protein, partial [Nitrososphaerales archaeon]
MQTDPEKGEHRRVIIARSTLEGDLYIPLGAQAIVLFAHGSGSSRYSARNQYVAQALNSAGIGTLLVDLLTREEKDIDNKTRHLRFDIELLASRIESVTNWLAQESETRNLAIGYFGSSTGAAAALISASKFNGTVKAVVSRGGRVDLSHGRLRKITSPTLLIVGGSDTAMIGMHETALEELEFAEAKEMVVIPGAGHMFDEPGKMEEVARVGTDWFECYLLRSGKKFQNRYHHKVHTFPSAFGIKNMFQIKFKNRDAAGEMLAKLLSKYKNDSPIVIG